MRTFLIFTHLVMIAAMNASTRARITNNSTGRKLPVNVFCSSTADCPSGSYCCDDQGDDFAGIQCIQTSDCAFWNAYYWGGCDCTPSGTAPLIRTGGTYATCDAFNGFAVSFSSGNLNLGLSGPVPLTWCRVRGNGRRQFRGVFSAGNTPLEVRGLHSPRASSNSWAVKIGVPGKLDAGTSNFCRYSLTITAGVPTVPVHTGAAAWCPPDWVN
jgi:hypothetical protein